MFWVRERRERECGWDKGERKRESRANERAGREREYVRDENKMKESVSGMRERMCVWG